MVFLFWFFVLVILVRLTLTGWPSCIAGFLNVGLRFVNLMVEFAFCGAVFRRACIYAPNRNPDCNDCFVHCVNAIDPAVPILLCGNFYTVFDYVLDRRELGPF